MSDPGGRELTYEVERFLFREADLLDERRYDEWLELLDERIEYVMPLVRNVPRGSGTEYSVPGRDLCWFDEGITTLQRRVAQIKTNLHWAEEPPSRVSHLVTNVRVLDVRPGDPEHGEIEQVTSRCRFLVYQNRVEDEVNIFVGRRTDVLLRTADGWRLRRREILLDQNVLLAKALTVFF